MASREYSTRLGVISDEQLQAALDRFDLGRFVAAEPIANGLGMREWMEPFVMMLD